ncbi:MAG: dihydroorotase family protein [Candidatus Korarchaeota archaeon]|nr:dihydroorotase family protein [Candidatus Korarchaeota archaeon]
MTCLCGLAYLPSLGFERICVEFGSTILKVSKASDGPCTEVDVVLPGFVDLHVHMRGLGQRHKGEWRTESLAALHGGVTVVVDMPNNVPRVDNLEILRRKLEEADRESYVDFMLYTAYPFLPDESYVAGVKLFPSDLMNDLNEVFSRASKLGKVVVVHAEDPLILQEAEKPTRVEDHWRAHPELAEDAAVRRALWLAERHGTKVRIAHSTLPITLRLVQGAKVRGVDASAEVTPHHILYNIEDSPTLGPLAKVNPPLRSKPVVEEFRRMVHAGMADFLATDHAPHSPEEKSRPYEEMPPGIPWLDLMAPLLMTMIGEGIFPAGVIDMYSSRPAAHLGLKRGKISPGSAADLVVLRKESWTIREDDMYTKARSAPVREVGWVVKKVYLKGKLAYDSGPVVEEGFGSPA